MIFSDLVRPETGIVALVVSMWGLGCFPDRVDTNTPVDMGGPTCEQVSQCEPPPPNVCEGRLAVTYTQDPSGCSCSVFKEYTDCAARGERCEDGMCVEVSEACRGVVCSGRPATCGGRFMVVSFNQPGVCNEETGECDYERSQLNCNEQGLRCVDGRCAPLLDPCAEEECQRPNRRCEGDVQIRHSGNGTCSAESGEAVCDFSRVEQRIDCTAENKTCVDGNCIDPNMPCEGVMCDMPPAASCDGQVAVTYTGNGMCNMADGMCDYSGAEMRTDCAAMGQMCMSGACVADNPCDNVTCNMPPAAACDGDVAVTYMMTDGVCNMADGMCDYSANEIRTDCTTMSRVCAMGICQDPANPCEGVMCDMPPAASCDGQVAVTYTGNGMCNMADGMCDYSGAEMRTDCAATGQMCMNGACMAANPCDMVTCDMPPAASCDGQVAVTYTGNGVCNMADGMCDYSGAEMRTDCAAMGQMCMSGACMAGDPCEGVMCDMPPADFCDGQEAVTYTGNGMCNMADGMCDYSGVETRTDCAAMAQTCMNGACM